MQAFDDIMARLSDAQKIRILTELSSLSMAELRSFGLAEPSFLRLDTSDADFPSPSVLARSFDASLIQELAASRADGFCHVVSPSAKGAIGDPDASISEDPYLSGRLSEAYASGIRSVGALPYLMGYCADGTSPRLTEEQLTAPFKPSLPLAHAVVAEPGSYPDAAVVLRKSVDAKETVAAISRGEICISASSSALAGAIFNYRNLKSKLDRGKIASSELDSAIKNGDAISDEAVDRAVLATLSFLSSGRGESSRAVSELGSLSSRAFDASSVLLSNENRTLPLTRPTRLAVLGDIERLSGNRRAELEALAAEAGHSIIGFAPGYELGCDRSDALLRPACELAARSDAVILLLGTDKSEYKDRLPPAQLALCRSLHRMKKKLIMVISCEHALDLGFIPKMENPPSAVLLAPLGLKNSLISLFEMLFGRRTPKGRLNETFTDKKLADMSRRGVKTGIFVGYRFYDTVGAGALFPFGHGLSYTDFQYSHLTLTEKEVSFTVKNVGRRRGRAVAQLYVGIAGSRVLRPKKELVGICPLELDPGESQDVALPLTLPPVAGVVEPGVYTVSVGESVSDIRLTRKLTLRGADHPADDNESICDYLPTHSNILKDNYTLEADHKMRPTVRSLILGIAALLLAVGVKIYDIVTLQNSLFLNIVSMLLIIGAIVFFVLEALDRKKERIAEQKALDDANRALFEGADRISAVNAESLFTKASEESEPTEEKSAESEKKAYDYYADVDRTLDLPMSAAELSGFAAENGVIISKKASADILAALASSRIVILKGMTSEAFASLAFILGNYFAAPAGIDSGAETELTELKNVIRAASNAPREIHIAFMDEARPQELTPLCDYARSPFGSHTVEIAGDRFELSNNIWLILNLSSDARLSELSEQLAQTAAVIAVSLEIAERKTALSAPRKPFSFGQLIYLTEIAKKATSLDESIWKKLDLLEAYAARYSEFSLGNKRTVGLESHYAVLAMSDPEAADLIDRALAAKLVPSLIISLEGKLPREETGLGAKLDELFGEHGTGACRRMISTKN